jgi:hypothetical protein
MSVLTLSRQEMVAAMATRGRERPILGRVVVVASAAELGQVRRRLLNIVKDLREEFERDDQNVDAAADVERWALTLTFAPVSSSARRP